MMMANPWLEVYRIRTNRRSAWLARRQHRRLGSTPRHSWHLPLPGNRELGFNSADAYGRVSPDVTIGSVTYILHFPERPEEN